MKLLVWIDMQLPPVLADWLAARFSVEAVHISTLGLDRATDKQVFDAARQQGTVILTKDADFGVIVNRLGPPPQIVWLRFGNRTTPALKNTLELLLPQALQLVQAGEALIEIAEARR